MKYSINAIIPARGGSVRVKDKNLRMICGHPLVAWSIVQARGAKHVGDVWVTTDSDRIEAVAKRYGAKIIRRPKWMHDNKYAANVPYRHAMEYLKESGQDTDDVVCLLPTSPLRLPGDIDRTIEHFYKAAPFPAGEMKQCIGLARRQDTSIYIDEGNGRADNWMTDKDRRYLDFAGAVSVYNADIYIERDSIMQELMGGPIEDAKVDAFGMNEYMRQFGTHRIDFVEMQPWQAFEIDTIAQYNLVQQLMQHYIMHDRHRDIYEIYGVEK